MKKSLLFAVIALLATVSMNGKNTITMGADSIRIKPACLDGYSPHTVTMYNEAFVDSWQMAVTYPQGLMVKLVSGTVPLDGMSIPYYNRYGEAKVYEAPLNVSAAYANIASEITENGYWDYKGNGEWDSYGTIKWAPGAHAMFEYNLFLDPSFRSGYIIFDGRMTSGSDARGPILSDVRFYTRTYVWVGYMKGDVSGNDKLTIEDVTELIDYLLGGNELDEFELKAADVDDSGKVTIADVTALIDILLNRQ
jgi:hypothetical protein